MSTADKPGRDRGAGAGRRRVVRITSSDAKRQRAASTQAPAQRADLRVGICMTPAPTDVVSVPGSPGPTAGSAMLAELQATGFIGMWKSREDIQDSTEFVQRLREQIQVRADGGTPAE